MYSKNQCLQDYIKTGSKGCHGATIFRVVMSLLQFWVFWFGSLLNKNSFLKLQKFIFSISSVLDNKLEYNN